jgi:hypothetical protein
MAASHSATDKLSKSALTPALGFGSSLQEYVQMDVDKTTRLLMA